MVKRTWTRITRSRLGRSARWEYLVLVGVETAAAVVGLPLWLHLMTVVLLHVSLARLREHWAHTD